MLMPLQMFIKSTKPAFLPILCYAFALFFVLIFSKLETILKINRKYFEKCLQLSNKAVYLSYN